MNRDDIRILRNIICISQDKLAQKIGTSRQMLCSFETGLRKIPIKLQLALLGYFLLEAEGNKVLSSAVKECGLIERMKRLV